MSRGNGWVCGALPKGPDLVNFYWGGGLGGVGGKLKFVEFNVLYVPSQMSSFFLDEVACIPKPLEIPVFLNFAHIPFV